MIPCNLRNLWMTYYEASQNSRSARLCDRARTRWERTTTIRPASHWIIDLPIANPMSVYEEYKAKRTSWGINALGTVVVEVELDDGIIGIGCSIGGEPACYIIEKHLSRFVEGQDPRNVELIWDQMWRATMPYGRKGLAIQALSAVDLAIWDCLGKVRG